MGKVAEIGVGATTVAPSSVLVTQPEGRVVEGVMGRERGVSDSDSDKSATTAVPMQHNIAHEAGRPMPESNATAPKLSGRGSIDVHPGAGALNHSLPTAAAIVTTNEARQAEQNVMSTPDSKMEREQDPDIDAVDLNAVAPDPRVDTLGSMIDPPGTRDDDAPGTKKETGLGDGKSGKEVAPYDSGEHEDMLHRVGISPVVLHRLTVFSV